MGNHMRHDQAASPTVVEKAFGWMFEAVVARVHGDGDALVYESGPEHRDVAELRRLVEQMPGKPVTLYHPDEMIGDRAHPTIVGRIIDARLDGDLAIARLRIESRAAREAVLGGIRQLSLGYLARTDARRYQRDTVVDHLALVPRGRCGAQCAITRRLDASVSRAHVDCGGACSCAMPARYDASSVEGVRILALANTIARAADERTAIPEVSAADIDSMIASYVALNADAGVHADAAYVAKNRHPVYCSIMLRASVERAQQRYVAAVARRDADEKRRADLERALIMTKEV